MIRFLVLLCLAMLNLHCAQQSPAGKAQATDQGDTSANDQTSPDWLHFFSVAWGCIEIEKAALDAADYTVQDFSPSQGKCPDTLQVLGVTSTPLLNCEVTIGPPAVPAKYILYDKRSLDGRTVQDLREQGFTELNFCPALSEREFKLGEANLFLKSK